MRNWIANPPSWVEVRHAANPLPGSLLDDLGAGETAALTLAAELHADLVLIDDRRAVTAAREMGITVTGTMGLLARASKAGLIDLAEAFAHLKLTNFRYRQETLDKFLADEDGKT